ncbi:unnamed protein product [Pseudo-nitzschia multistriata]|uniref:Uncharacterized protein n=1 Tax=Pseudo-nitzschia multistriata TaxID=183589 RepID=A0A448ZSR0_9STRA|nr:unnamed protein product [Pseudo-nitzschia multistriata]
MDSTPVHQPDSDCPIAMTCDLPTDDCCSNSIVEADENLELRRFAATDSISPEKSHEISSCSYDENTEMLSPWSSFRDSDETDSLSIFSSGSSWDSYKYTDLRYTMISNLFFFVGACIQTYTSAASLKSTQAEWQLDDDSDWDDDDYVPTVPDRAWYALYSVGPFLYIINACIDIRWNMEYLTWATLWSRLCSFTRNSDVSPHNSTAQNLKSDYQRIEDVEADADGEENNTISTIESSSTSSADPSHACWQVVVAMIFGTGAVFEFYSTFLDDYYEDEDDGWDDDSYLISMESKRKWFFSNYRIGFIGMHLYLLSGLIELISQRNSYRSRCQVGCCGRKISCTNGVDESPSRLSSMRVAHYLMFLGTILFVCGTILDCTMAYLSDPDIRHYLDPTKEVLWDVNEMTLATSDLISSLLWNVDAILYIMADILLFDLHRGDSKGWKWLCGNFKRHHYTDDRIDGVAFLSEFEENRRDDNQAIELSLRPSDEIDCECDEKDDGDEASSVSRSPRVEKLEGGESTPLLSNSSSIRDGIGYGGNSSGSERGRDDNIKIDARISIPKRPSSNSLHKLSPRKSIGIDTNSSFFSTDETEDDEKGFGNAARFSKPSTDAFEKLRIITCHNTDSQTKAMLALGIPYLLQALVSAVSEFIQMAIVGHYLGTAELSALVVVDLFVKLTSGAVASVIISSNIMISQIAEAEDEKSVHKIGKYIQFSILFYLVGMIPIVIFWSYCTKDILLFLKLDPTIADVGEQYVTPYIISIVLEGVVAAFQQTLDVVGFEVQSTICTILGEVGTVSMVAVALVVGPLFAEVTLGDLGWVYVFASVCYLAGILTAIYCNGWLEDYYKGFFSSPLTMFAACGNGDNSSGTNVVSGAAIELLISNAFQLAFNDMLYNGEWQLLILFASSLGPAEVAAWSVLGVIWEELEYLVTAIAEGCEVRVAVALGSGNIKNAKLTSYKAIWICFVWGLIVSIGFYLFEDTIAALITTDSTLREIVSFNLPMISLINMISGIGIMAEHVLWSQNRAPLSTVIASATSCLVTLPLAGLSSYYFNFNLIGQTASVALGGSMFVAVSMYFVVSSDWKKISEDVVSLHLTTKDDSSNSESDNDREADE